MKTFPHTLVALLLCLLPLAAFAAPAELRIGIIGTDTSHVIAFARIFNDPAHPEHLEGARVTVAFKGGSPDIESSRTRVDNFTKQLAEQYGVKIVATIDELAAQVDAIMIESVDGRVHLEQARAAFRARKPVFIDKPLAGSLRDALEIARLAREYQVPVFSSSSLRYYGSLAKLKASEHGELRGAFSYGPAHKEPHHPDLFWYAIHPAEALYTVMGTGCQGVVRTATDDTDVVTGTWPGGRVGVLYGIREAASPYRVTLFGTKAVVEQEPERGGYQGLARAVLGFFRTGISPVPMEETIEIFAFLEAADESKRRGGAPVTLAEVMALHSRP